MLPLITMHITAVRDSCVLFANKYTAAFGDGMIKHDLPPAMKCKWEEIAAYPSMETASCATDQGSRLMDILEFLGSSDFAHVLQSTGFIINEATRSMNVWVRAARCSISASIPQSTKSQDDTLCVALRQGQAPGITSILA